MDEDVTRATEALEKITFVTKHAISLALAEDFAMTPHIKTLVDHHAQAIVTVVRQSMLSQKLDEISVRYPADWWQAVKERFAPGWFKRRWPVEYNKTVIDVRAVYPKMTPGEAHFPLARILEEGTAIVDGWGEYVT